VIRRIFNKSLALKNSLIFLEKKTIIARSVAKCRKTKKDR